MKGEPTNPSDGGEDQAVPKKTRPLSEERIVALVDLRLIFRASDKGCLNNALTHFRSRNEANQAGDSTESDSRTVWEMVVKRVASMSGGPCTIHLSDRECRSFNRLFKDVSLLPLDDPYRYLFIARDPSGKGVVTSKPSRKSAQRKVATSALQVESMGLADFRNFVRRTLECEGQDQDIDAAVRLWLVRLDAKTNREPVRGIPRRPAIDRPLIALSARMRTWPECLRFVVQGPRLVGYISCVPVLNEELLGNTSFYQSGCLIAENLEGGVEARAVKVLFVSSIRLDPEVRNGANGMHYRQALTKGFYQIKDDLSARGCSFERVYVCTHHPDEDKFCEGLVRRTAKHAQLEKEALKMGLCHVQAPLWRIHVS